MARAFSVRSFAAMEVLTSSGSSSACPIFWRGFREPYGFWNTICTRERSDFSVAAEAPAISCPAITREPDVGCSIMVTRRARVDLPQPDSPTTASVLPRWSVKLAPSSAFSVAGLAKAPRATV